MPIQLLKTQTILNSVGSHTFQKNFENELGNYIFKGRFRIKLAAEAPKNSTVFPYLICGRMRQCRIAVKFV